MTQKSIVTLIACTLLVAMGPINDASANPLGAGSQHTVVVTPDGRVWTWGANSFGQLGDGTVTSHKTPLAIPSLTGVIAVAAGQNFTLALKNDGTVWAWGYNPYGQLGDNSTLQRSQPIQVSGLSGVIAIAAGDNHSVALTSDGYVWAWGLNSSGQLGDGTTTLSKIPKQVSTAPAMAVGAGSSHTLIVKTDGTVWGMGANATGQLGDGTVTNSRTTPVQMTGISSAVAVAGGNAHSLVLLADGSLKAVGSNSFSQLGDSSNISSRTTAVSVTGLSAVMGVAASQAHSYAVRSDGTLWTWGFDALGVSGVTQRNVPGQVAAVSSVAAAAAGQGHGIAVSTAGIVSTWGNNIGGQLGDGTTLNRSVPDAISEANYAWKTATPTFSVAGGTYNTTKTVVVSCVTPGAEIHYTLNDVVPTASDPLIVSGSSLVIDQTATLQARALLTGYPQSNIAIAAYVLTPIKPTVSPNGGTFTSPQTVTLSTITTAASIRYTTDGSTPSESSTLYTGPINIGTSTTLSAVAVRSNWTPSASATAVFQMNFGTLAPPAISPSPGTYLSQALVSMTSISGAAIRYTTNGTTPTTSSPLYTGVVSIGTSSTVIAKAFHPDYNSSPSATATYTIVVEPPIVSPGGGTYPFGQVLTAATPTSGAVITYTLNGLVPTATDPVLPSSGIIAGNYTLKLAAWKLGATPSTVISATYQVSGTTRPGMVLAGGTHSLVLRPDGVMLAWGNNASGQLGDGTTNFHGTPNFVNGVTGAITAAAGDSHSLAVLSNANAAAWGSNGGGRLGDNTIVNRPLPTAVMNIQAVASVAGGFLHSLALTQDGSVWAWGNNASGQLGIADPAQQLTPVHLPNLTNIVAIATRESSSFALASDGTVWSWGVNANGQLGSGNTIGRPTPDVVLGLLNVQTIASGSFHALALLADGTVRAWGLNASGQVGDGTLFQRTSPVSISSLTGVIAIAAGGSHSLALRQDGSVWAWGANANGQLGDGSGLNRSTPVQVPGLPPISSIAAGKNHSLALGEDGSLWAWGRNTERQLGDGSTINAAAPICILAAGTLAPAVSRPAFSLAGGEYIGRIQVPITSSTPQSSIRWTIDNSEPTESSFLYSGPIDISPGTTLTIKARAFRQGWAPSEIATATFSTLLGKVPTPVATPSSGSVDAYVAVALTLSDSFAKIRFTTDGTLPTTTSPLYSSYSAIILQHTATIKAKAFRAGYAPSDVLIADYQISTSPILLSLNDSPPADLLCLSPGSPVSLVVTNGTGNAGDWVGLYELGKPHVEYLDWWYLNGSQERPANGVTSASFTFAAPTIAGEYDVRFCHDDRYDCARHQATFMVAQGSACLAISAPHPGTTTMAASSLSVQSRGVALDGPLSQVELFNGNVSIGVASAAPYDITWDQPIAGVHTLSAIGNISSGGVVASNPIVANVSDHQLFVNDTLPPTQLIVSAGANLTVSANSPTPFDPAVSVGLYRVESGDATPLSWAYMNGTHSVPQGVSTNPSVNPQAQSQTHERLSEQ